MQIERVLLVDDDASIRKISEITLSKVGKWTVFLAESGKQGIEVALRELPDIILLDVMMPVMDGPATLRMIREIPELSDIPVIFMTAKVQKHELTSYCQMGAAGVISKPFDPLTLPQTIKQIIEEQLAIPA